ncbi:MAG: methyltransferase [Methylococcales bacterium]
MNLQKNPVSVYCFDVLMRFAVWLQFTINKITPPPFRLIQIGSAFWQSRALYAATRLNIASLLGDEQLTADDIAERILAKPDAIYRLLRMLAAMGIFEEVSSHVFKNNKLSAFLRDDHPKNVRAMILMHNSMEMSKPWYEQLEQGLRLGDVPFEIAHGQAFYTYLDGHVEFDALFSLAMDSVEALTGESFVTDFNWGAFNRIIDVGGSKGNKALAILKQYPHLTAVVFDREQVIKTAATYWAEKALPDLFPRLIYQAENLLESVPKAKDDKDIYLLSAVLHGLDDGECVTVLRNVVTAIADSGARIALMELIVPELKADISSASIDMQMFMATRGKERTLAEWKGLFEQSGLRIQEIVSLKSIGKILVLNLKV